MESNRKKSASHRSRPRALVTGASAGIGAAFAERLARDGFDLVIVARRKDRLERLADRLRRDHKSHVEVVAADLTSDASLRRVGERVTSERPECLINNAGFGTAGAFAELGADGEENEIRLNVIALVSLTRAALPAMIARGRGSIINVSSMAGFQPGPYMATYGATKAYVNSFTEALYEELRGTGVRVLALCPGFTRTEFQERAGMDVSSVPSFVWMTAEAVVDAALAAVESGDVLCIPGFGNRVVSAVSGIVPRPVVRRVMGAAMRLMES